MPRLSAVGIFGLPLRGSKLTGRRGCQTNTNDQVLPRQSH